jgi:hypothetical protein
MTLFPAEWFDAYSAWIPLPSLDALPAAVYATLPQNLYLRLAI